MNAGKNVDLQDRPEGFRRVSALLAQRRHGHAPVLLEVAGAPASDGVLA